MNLDLFILFKRSSLISIFLFIGINSSSQRTDSLQVDKQCFIINNNVSYQYSKPKFLETFKYIPRDLADLGKYLISKENLMPVLLATSSTVAIIPFDQKLTDEAAILGKTINLDNEGTYLRISGMRILPSNFPSTVYYIGNGGTTLILSGSFFIFGKINKDYRMLATSSELLESLISVGLVSQTVKRITGRESPVVNSDHPGGKWRPFPSFKEYQSHTPKYDAMPSGHLATFMAALTIISTNYAEVKWIKPVGYSLASLLAFQMVSSEVHWTSDYPLAILFGYAVGKSIANRRINKIHKIKIANQEIKYNTNFSFSNIQGCPTVGLHISF